MSMIGNFLRVTKAELDDYLKDSTLLENRIYNDEAEDEKLVDIEKAWAGILFLLTGKDFEEAEDHPLMKVFFSGQLIDEEQDLGYGPAHYLTPQQVAELNTQISQIKVSDLKQKFDPAKMTEAGVYPSIWDEGNEAFEYLAEYFKIMQQVYSDATKNNEVIITFIN